MKPALKPDERENLTCPVCKKDFTGYVLSVTEHCDRCGKFKPFLLETGADDE